MRLFNFWHAWHMCNFLAACKPRATREIQLQVPTSLHNLEHFFTFSHTLPLHDSHLNTGLLITKIQTNLARNKANKMVDKIQPYIESRDKGFVLDLKLLFTIVDCFSRRFPPRFFIAKLVCFIGFPWSSYLVLFTFPLRMILT